MLILQIASGDFFSTYGGGQVYVKNIVDEMIRQQYNIVVISFLENDTEITQKTYKGIDLYEIGRKGVKDLFSLITGIMPDVIHAHSHKDIISDIGDKLGIPVVVTAHHGGIVCPAGTLMDCHDRICEVPVSHKNCLKCVLRNTRTGLFWYPIMKILPYRLYLGLGKLLRKLPFILFVTPIGTAALSISEKEKEWNEIKGKCSRMIAPCEKIAASMVMNGLDKHKITILPHGIPLPKEVPAYPKINDGKIKFFYVGRICYVKGLHILLEAFHKLNAPSIELHLIGGAANNQEKRYENILQQKYSSDKRIFWHGKFPPSDIYKKISEMHISTSPAIYLEVFGLNIAEALAIGKPVLATRNGGAEMQIRDNINGWLVPQNDVNTMEKKMKEIIDNFKSYDTELSTSSVISIEKHVNSLKQIYKATINYEKDLN